MPWDLVVFYLLAAVCILAAGGMVAASNPVHSAIFLVICFFNVAGIFVMLGRRVPGGDPGDRLHRRDHGAAALRVDARRSR